MYLEQVHQDELLVTSDGEYPGAFAVAKNSSLFVTGFPLLSTLTISPANASHGAPSSKEKELI